MLTSNKKIKVRLVVYAWGKDHVDLMLNSCLAAALSPGNIPTLVSNFNFSVAIVTEEKFFEYIKIHPIGIKLSNLCDLFFKSIDDVLTENWQYGITLTYALMRGFEDLEEDFTNSFVLFLNADFVLADGSYSNLSPYIFSDTKILVAPSYCVNTENVLPFLKKNAEISNGEISISHREMSKLILNNLHGTVKAKILNQNKYYYKYTDQFYWLINDSLLIGHQMPIALVGLRPEVFLKKPTTFWDWGIVWDFCPSRETKVIGDSDEFLILELRDKVSYLDSICLGEISSNSFISGTSGYITEYQLASIEYPLTLHADDLPASIDIQRKALKQKIDTLLSKAILRPSHYLHSQWLYHQNYLDTWQKLYKQGKPKEQIKKEIDNLNKILPNNTNLFNSIKKILRLRFYKLSIISEYGAKSIIWNLLPTFTKSLIKILKNKEINNILLISSHDNYNNNIQKFIYKYKKVNYISLITTDLLNNDFSGININCELCIIFLDYRNANNIELVLDKLKILLKNKKFEIFIQVIQPHFGRLSWINNLYARLLLYYPHNYIFVKLGGKTIFHLFFINLALFSNEIKRKNKYIKNVKYKFIIFNVTMGVITWAIFGISNLLDRLVQYKNYGSSIFIRINK